MGNIRIDKATAPAMAGAEARSGVAIEVLVEQKPVPRSVRARQMLSAEEWSPALGIGQEDAFEASRNVGRDLVQVPELTGTHGMLDAEVVAVEVVELL